MGVRGKKSSASLAVAAVKLPGQRPQPPSGLSEERAEVWRAVVGAMPADWFRPENFELLVDYTRHVERARRLDEVLREMMAQSVWSDDIKQVLLSGRTETAAIVNLARQMRLSQVSRANHTSAATAVKHETNGTRPWQRTG